jgi:hypothetical protein
VDEVGFPKNCEVLREHGLGKVEVFGELSRRHVSVPQELEYVPAGGDGKRIGRPGSLNFSFANSLLSKLANMQHYGQPERSGVEGEERVLLGEYARRDSNPRPSGP